MFTLSLIEGFNEVKSLLSSLVVVFTASLCCCDFIFYMCRLWVYRHCQLNKGVAARVQPTFFHIWNKNSFSQSHGLTLLMASKKNEEVALLPTFNVVATMQWFVFIVLLYRWVSHVARSVFCILPRCCPWCVSFDENQTFPIAQCNIYKSTAFGIFQWALRIWVF